ncbi:MAG: hypothetical protein QXF56_00550 [Candidatus Micrarchaeia archaeon]
MLVVTVKERMEIEQENLKNLARMRSLMLDSKLDKLYGEFWETAKQKLEKLGFQTDFLEKIKNPAKFGMLITGKCRTGEFTVMAELGWVEGELNKLFAKRNNLPERVEDTKEMKRFLSNYVKEKAGSEFKIEIKEYKDANCRCYRDSNKIGFKEGLQIIDVPDGVLHELAHYNEPWSHREILLCPKNIKRAQRRYSEGRAVFTEMSLARSEDDALAAYNALQLMRHIAELTPQLYFDEGKRREKLIMHFARASEGFRMYYSLVQSVGEENLRNFEKACGDSNMRPGIMEDGTLIVITPFLKVFKVDTEKLAEGETSIEKLKSEEVKMKGMFERLKLWKKQD